MEILGSGEDITFKESRFVDLILFNGAEGIAGQLPLIGAQGLFETKKPPDLNRDSVADLRPPRIDGEHPLCP